LSGSAELRQCYHTGLLLCRWAVSPAPRLKLWSPQSSRPLPPAECYRNSILGSTAKRTGLPVPTLTALAYRVQDPLKVKQAGSPLSQILTRRVEIPWHRGLATLTQSTHFGEGAIVMLGEVGPSPQLLAVGAEFCPRRGQTIWAQQLCSGDWLPRK
jgi:hypothetical protein